MYLHTDCVPQEMSAFNDSFRNYDVVLQGCPLYLSCKSIWHGTNGSLDWYVRRLVYPLRNLFGQIFKRPVAEKAMN